MDKSLVQEAPEAPPLAPDEAPQPRFRMLNTVREFALHAEAGQEVAACERRHATYWLGVAERARTGLHGPAQAAWLRRLELDQDNLAQALGWAVAHGEATLGLRLGAGLFRFWWVRGDFAEGRRWLEGLLALREPPAPPAALRAGALTARRHPWPSSRATSRRRAGCRRKGWPCGAQARTSWAPPGP